MHHTCQKVFSLFHNMTLKWRHYEVVVTEFYRLQFATYRDMQKSLWSEYIAIILCHLKTMYRQKAYQFDHDDKQYFPILKYYLTDFLLNSNNDCWILASFFSVNFGFITFQIFLVMLHYVLRDISEIVILAEMDNLIYKQQQSIICFYIFFSSNWKNGKWKHLHRSYFKYANPLSTFWNVRKYILFNW